MSKKTLTIIGVSLLVIIIIVGVYFFFIRNKTTETGGSNDNPFGTGGANNQSAGGNGNQNNSTSGSNSVSTGAEQPILWKISSTPVSGATITGSGSSTIIRYVEKATGHIYEENSISRTPIRISNTTIPKSESIVWGKNAKSLLYQYENNGTIKTYYARISTTTATTTEQGLVGGKYLNDDIDDVVSSPSQDKIFYSLATTDLGALIVSNFDGGNTSTISASRFKEWLVSWPKETLYTITTKPSASIPGYLYFIDPKIKILEKVLGDIDGLTTLTDKNGEKVVYSESKKGTFDFNLFSKKDDSRIPLSPDTLPEKCVWGTKKTQIVYCGVPKEIPTGDYPDSWYQGRMFFSDNIWMYDTDTGVTSELIDLLKQSNENIDLVNPVLSTNGDLLIFRNKIDYSLWGLKIDPNKIPQFVD